MSDLIERLRRLYVQTGMNYVQEAADEIERLQERLRIVAAERDEHARWRQKLADDLHDRETQIIELRRVYMPVESGGICPSPTAYYPVELAPVTPQAEPKRDWSAIDAAICEYLDGYELIGENDAGADACYTPTERERDLIYDAINGLLADEHFMRLIAPHPAPAAPQAEPKREPVGTLTIRDDMGAEITFHRSFTMRPRQTFAIYPNWDLLTHDIPIRGAFVVNALKESGND